MRKLGFIFGGLVICIFMLWALLQIRPPAAVHAASGTPTRTPVSVGTPNTYPTPVPLNILYRTRVGANDSMTTQSWSECIRFTPCDGQFFYVPASLAVASTMELRRYANSSDHMDANYCCAIAGYTPEPDLGFPWQTQASSSGTVALWRWHNVSTGDHKTAQATETPVGYTPEGGLGYGYPRAFNAESVTTPLTYSTPGTNTSVTIESNAAAGGAIWRWCSPAPCTSDDAANQFINNHDYGRQLQSALFYANGSAGSLHDFDPNQAGDASGTNVLLGTQPGQRHGSPVIEMYNSNYTQYNRTIPLQSDLNPQDTTTIHNTMWISKSVQLDYPIQVNGLTYAKQGVVAKYLTYLSLSAGPLHNALLEIPTIYARGNFNRYYIFDPQVNTNPVEVTSQMNCGYTDDNPYLFNTFQRYGGVILMDSGNTSNAIGIFGVSVNYYGGSVREFGLWDFTSRTCGPTYSNTGMRDPSTAKLAAESSYWNHQPPYEGTGSTFSQGLNFRQSWIVSGTMASVTADMQALATCVDQLACLNAP